MEKHYMRLEYYFVVDSETEDEAYAALEAIHNTCNFHTIFTDYQKNMKMDVPVRTSHGTIPVHYDGVEIYEYKERESQ